MKLSPYELLRLERIKRNAERLKELGLDKNPLQKAKPKKRKFKKVDKPTPGQERRSKRLSSKKNDDDLVMLDYRAKDGEEIVSKQNGADYDSDVAPQRRIGTVIRKKFPETGEYYEGKVTDYDTEYKWYKIKYLDGDEEELDEEELKLHRRVGTIIRKELSKTGKYHSGEVIEYDTTCQTYRVRYSNGEEEEDISPEELKKYRVQKRKILKQSNKRVRQKSRSLKIDAEDWKLSEKDRQSLACADENFLAKFQEFLEYENRISEQNKRNVMRQVRKLASGEGIRYEVCDLLFCGNRLQLSV